ncbi:MAG: pilus assembly protein TadG-related protein, partial [Rhodocyclaceae bacterium]|nr:pilus assembly protein TadG-related protein [Rhodocyclaceae bacterium]
MPSRQRGAVAVVVGLSLVVLIGFLGLVLDLGQLFITRTELQNAADAAALAGAKELDGTVAGITRAKDRARQTAAANSVRFGGGGGAVQLGDLNIEFAPTPSGNWVPLAAALAAPGGLSFIKIDTRTPAIVQGSVSTRIMHIMNAFGLPGLPVSSVMNTYGFAVAGAYFTNVAPMGVCAVDPGNRVANDNSELVEFGFRRGMSYNIVQINDEKKGLAGLSQVPLWANPVDQYPDPCDTANNSDAV